MGGTRAAQLVQPDNAYAIPYGTHVTHQDSGNVYYSNAVIQSPAGFSHVTPQSYGPVYSNNAGPGPGCNGSYGHVTHDSYQAGPNNGVVTAQGSYIDHSNVGAPHGDHQVDYNNCMMIQESNMGFPHDSHLVHGSSTGMAILNNVAAPIPSHAGKQIKYFVNPHTGDKMTLDGTVWTPHGEKKDLFAESSIYNQTEPRNFAPRPMGSPIMFPPPPTFNLVAGANSQAPEIVSNEAIFDPFSSPTSSATNAANQVAFSQADSQELTCSEPTEGKGRLSREWGLLRNKLAMLRALGSAGLQNLISGDQGIPSESVLLRLDNFPFIESSSQSMPATWGVIKISNIPFGTTRAEIIAFLGRNSKIVNDAQEGIHIIMERVTSKTGDAFVEFSSQHAANRAMERYREAIRKHRHPRLGDRPVDMTMSSQKELMEVLFPWCHGVKFNHGRAEMLPFDEKNPWNVFRGFVTEEEMALVIKHVEVPSRSPYSKDCPQRPYECMISTLKKLPWYRSDVITLKQRQILFDTTCRLIEILYHLIQKGDQKGDRSTNNRHEENVLNEQLYKRLVNAAMLCPGFSVLQKDNIAYIAGLTGPRIAQFNMPPFAECWSHLYNLCPRPGVPVDVLEWYIALIREETVRFVGTLPEDEQAAIKERAQDDSLYFGYMWYEIQLPQGKGLADMTLRDVAKKELEAIKRALRRAATVAHSPRAIEGASQHLDHRQVI
ncbi:hypothetical protein QBC36DRAFT_242713 [Triangularia setosa]|uniref:RRM domain-containing protein n=1 Tax=Triangularia setosa TaxID=2587417 RepID=A0AAN7A5E9_9PEZI|nr:hypothetical protein QBC36DRAFT_242713 [Podospora setosa]